MKSTSVLDHASPRTGVLLIREFMWEYTAWTLILVLEILAVWVIQYVVKFLVLKSKGTVMERNRHIFLNAGKFWHLDVRS